jgi:hypothetical protein
MTQMLKAGGGEKEEVLRQLKAALAQREGANSIC